MTKLKGKRLQKKLCSVTDSVMTNLMTPAVQKVIRMSANKKKIWSLFVNNMNLSLCTEFCIEKEVLWMLVNQAARLSGPSCLAHPSLTHSLPLFWDLATTTTSTGAQLCVFSFLSRMDVEPCKNLFCFYWNYVISVPSSTYIWSYIYLLVIHLFT